MSRLSLTALFLFSGLLSAQTPRQAIDLSADWRFHLGAAAGAELPGHDHSAWKTLSLPHDWAFENGVSREGAQIDKGGYYSGGLGWYRKEFPRPKFSEGQQVHVHFDGVYMNSDVWLNGRHLGKFPYGYLSFRYDLTPHLVEGRNVLAVKVDNTREPSARWYHPCGIYAPVRLTITSRSRLEHLFVTTPEVTDQSATVRVRSEITGSSDTSVSHLILDPAGRQVAASTGDTLTVPDPRRWDLASPHLYTLVSRLHRGDTLVDEVHTRFGIRTIAWKPETGFWLNGRNVKLLGVCEHLEGGPVGGAWTPDLMRWKIQLLKDMGCNAIRTAHNPAPPFFYDLCDEMGMLVMDEIFDGWKKKAPHDYGAHFFAEHWKTDLTAWLKRNRNHPCIVIYSVGNETRGPVAPELVKTCHELDPTRPVTSGHSGSSFMDVYGVNGHSEKQTFYTKYERPKNKAFVATEGPHTWQVRGYYRSKTWFRDGFPNKRQAPFPLADLTEKEIFTYDWTAPANKTNRKQIFNSSYDNAMVRITARKNWELMRDLPWYSGHFRWTGFDYPGEAGYVHGGWPFRAFMGGPLDLAGFKKDLFHFYQSQWTTEPMVHLLPHWTHPRMEKDTPIPVWAYSNAQEVELLVNGQSLGRKRPGTKAEEMQCQWMVPWQAGTLTAIARTEGKEVARTTRTTAGPPAALALTSEAQGRARILTTTLTDAKGTHAPYADNRVHYHFDGPVRLHSHENGNPVDTENGVTSSSRRAFMGLTRSFLELGEATRPATATAAAILGARNGVSDPSAAPTVSIVVETVALHSSGGPAAPHTHTIHYTVDGSEPTSASPQYREPFSVPLPTTVRALVLRDGKPLMTLSELFAEDQGLYWSDGSEDPGPALASGLQAESAQLAGPAKVVGMGKGFRGQGFVDLPGSTASITWYQENDGPAGPVSLHFRYAQQDPKGKRQAKLLVNGKEAGTLTFTNTGSWNEHWKTLKTSIKIQPGANEISLVATGRGGPSIDELLVKD